MRLLVVPTLRVQSVLVAGATHERGGEGRSWEEAGFLEDPLAKENGSRMAKVTSKYHVTVQRKIAEEYQPAGPRSHESRLLWFDQATERHRKRRAARATKRPRGRGWRREDLY